MTDQPEIPLDEPIKRGETEIISVRLRRPRSGELRGLSMLDLMQMKVDSVHELLPRITVPPLTELEVRDVCLADFLKLSTEIASFFLPKDSPESPDE
ncbi:Phage tail assembly chaperone protein, E, or 41 or 14 [Novosphingobium sp. CF614]|uniref:phage tail assembly protein n=1 Tax=Novosphingobium sp. CF614 TaxID=1884364 RepID=UPI0008F0F2BE|nr:phage tail assembly protein [Novosphingobium sp. CF614]SFG08708.1 Phage tail assembly chaperone protein, E, or 41 or 14 [Novosphingobium sp. CF614]